MNKLILTIAMLFATTTAFAEDLNGIIKYLYPGAVNNFRNDPNNPNNYALQDDSDGRGVYISMWKLPYPEPTIAELRSHSQEFETYKSDKEADFQAAKAAVQQKLGLSKTDVDAMKGLLR